MVSDGGMTFEPSTNGSDNPSVGMAGIPFDPTMYPLGDQFAGMAAATKKSKKDKKSKKEKKEKKKKDKNRDKNGDETSRRSSKKEKKKRARDLSSSSSDSAGGRTTKRSKSGLENMSPMMAMNQFMMNMNNPGMSPLGSMMTPLGSMMTPLSGRSNMSGGRSSMSGNRDASPGPIAPMIRPERMPSSEDMQTLMNKSYDKTPEELKAMQTSPSGIPMLNRSNTMRSGGDATGRSFKRSGTMNQNDPTVADSFANRRARELYIGGLVAGCADRQNIKEFFAGLLGQLPEFKENYAGHPTHKGAVKEITIKDKEGSFAFVEFWTERLAATVIEFDGVNFQGRPLKIGRPAKFQITGREASPMDVTPLRECGLIPASRSEHANTPGYGGRSTPFTLEQREERARRSAEWRQRQAEKSPGDGSSKGRGKGGTPRPGRMNAEEVSKKKARELYVGNLTTGLCDKAKLIDLFKPACEMLPEYVKSMGPAILSVDVRGGGTFAFVEFQNERMATAALGIFDKMEVCGRCINVGRPNGYTGPTQDEANNFGKAEDGEPNSDNKNPAQTPGNGSTNGTPQRANSDMSSMQQPAMTPPMGSSPGQMGGLQHQNSTISMMSDGGMNGALPDMMNGMDPNMMNGMGPNMGMMNGMGGPMSPMDQFGNPMNGMDNSMMMNGGCDPNMMMNGGFDPNMGPGPMGGPPMGFDPMMNGMGMGGPPMDPNMMGPPMNGDPNMMQNNFGPGPGHF